MLSILRLCIRRPYSQKIFGKSWEKVKNKTKNKRNRDGVWFAGYSDQVAPEKASGFKNLWVEVDNPVPVAV
jgi:hypothetical protein